MTAMVPAAEPLALACPVVAVDVDVVSSPVGVVALGIKGRDGSPCPIRFPAAPGGMVS